MSGNFAARDRKSERLVIALARDDDLDDRAFLPLQHVGDFSRRKAVGSFFVDFDDDVTRTEARVISRRADVRRHDDCMVFAGRNYHADAVIAAALVFAKQGKLAGVKKIGVRVEDAQHAGDGALVDLFVDIDRIGVVGLHDVQNSSELFDGRLVIVGGGGSSADRRSIYSAQDGGDQQYQNNHE